MRKITFIAKATDDLVCADFGADWNEGVRHLRWIDEADAREVDDWLVSFYPEWVAEADDSE